MAQYFVGKKKSIDFSNHAYVVEIQNSDDARQRILSRSYSEWKMMGFSKGNLHYMKKNASIDKPLLWGFL